MIVTEFRQLWAALSTPRRWRRFAITTLIAVVIAVVVSLGWHAFPEVRLAVRDMAAAAGTIGGMPPIYTGWLVYVGVIGWFGSAAVALLLAIAAHRDGGSRTLAAFAYGFSAITLFLGVDDLFLLHDGVFLVLGISESRSLLVLALIVIAWGLLFLPTFVRDPDLPIFVLAVVFFAYAMLIEELTDLPGGGPLNEEAAKLAAIFAWSVWIVSFALRHLGLRVTQTAEQKQFAPAA